MSSSSVADIYSRDIVIQVVFKFNGNRALEFVYFATQGRVTLEHLVDPLDIARSF